MAEDEATRNLRTEMLRWYDRQHCHPVEGRRRLERLTDISARTLEKVEQSGRFRYPKALLFVLDNT